jgi:sugar lactone lactonase YvrE
MGDQPGDRELHVVPVPGPGAEDVLVGDDGRIWTGTADGSVFAVEEEGRRITRIARTGGRPLGLDWWPDGRLLVCDAHRGLLAIDTESGHVETVADSVGGRRLVFCNNADVTADGVVWFSDSSARWPIEEWRNDLIDDTCTGRLLRLEPGGEVEVVLGGLSFANGVALAPDESFVTVAETGHRTLRRVWLTGERQGKADEFLTDLPCHPDNTSTGTDGLVWVSAATPKDPTLTFLQTKAPPWAKATARRMPEALKPSPKRTVRVQAYDPDGRLVHDISCDATGYHMVTGVREHAGRVWLGSLAEPAVAWFDLEEGEAS